MLKFIILAYVFGPVIAIPYGSGIFSSEEIFIYLLIIYILPLPVLFKVLEFIEHNGLYRMAIFRKFSKVTHKKVQEVMADGDDILHLYETRMGYVGFYVAIAIFTFLFGIFWATLLSYLLRTRRSRAILAIGTGVVLGNIFWSIVLMYSIRMTQMQMALLGVGTYLIIYGRGMEIKVIKKIESILRLKRKKG
ncbi:MAG: hypothetical protein KAR20_16645 [Candidatus Heimdallarchaeota archaeon]|nr:hypothetical protein [Candidatus Heimdallarchaeota archaeon]